MVVAGLAGLNNFHVLDRPVIECRKRQLKGFAERRQGVFHPKRLPDYHGARDHAVAFQLAKCLRQYPLRNSIEASLDGIEATRLSQHHQDQHRPFVSDLIEDGPAWAVSAVNRIRIRTHRYAPAYLGC
ncbi:hypothetical protein PUN4_180069 [Paraburkholderia unamae]|nr:hypothetical protein PUN4_180069 [Paraburkholderia unamae]